MFNQPGRIRQLLSRDVGIPSPFAYHAKEYAILRDRLDQFGKSLREALAKQSEVVKAALKPFDKIIPEASK